MLNVNKKKFPYKIFFSFKSPTFIVLRYKKHIKNHWSVPLVPTDKILTIAPRPNKNTHPNAFAAVVPYSSSSLLFVFISSTTSLQSINSISKCRLWQLNLGFIKRNPFCFVCKGLCVYLWRGIKDEKPVLLVEIYI